MTKTVKDSTTAISKDKESKETPEENNRPTTETSSSIDSPSGLPSTPQEDPAEENPAVALIVPLPTPSPPRIFKLKRSVYVLSSTALLYTPATLGLVFDSSTQKVRLLFDIGTIQGQALLALGIVATLDTVLTIFLFMNYKFQELKNPQRSANAAYTCLSFMLQFILAGLSNFPLYWTAIATIFQIAHSSGDDFATQLAVSAAMIALAFPGYINEVLISVFDAHLLKEGIKELKTFLSPPYSLQKLKITVMNLPGTAAAIAYGVNGSLLSASPVLSLLGDIKGDTVNLSPSEYNALLALLFVANIYGLGFGIMNGNGGMRLLLEEIPERLKKSEHRCQTALGISLAIGMSLGSVGPAIVQGGMAGTSEAWVALGALSAFLCSLSPHNLTFGEELVGRCSSAARNVFEGGKKIVGGIATAFASCCCRRRPAATIDEESILIGADMNKSSYGAFITTAVPEFQPLGNIN